MELVLKIPDDVVEAVKLPPQEIEPDFRKELALALYQRSRARLVTHCEAAAGNVLRREEEGSSAGWEEFGLTLRGCWRNHLAMGFSLPARAFPNKFGIPATRTD
jgi:hypothetical protein